MILLALLRHEALDSTTFLQIRSVNFKIVFHTFSGSKFNYSGQSIFTAACHIDHMAFQFFVLSDFQSF